jgi:ABC-type multidrug transport system ATPase subunit
MAIVPGTSVSDKFYNYLTSNGLDASRVIRDYNTAEELDDYLTSKSYGLIDGSKVISAALILDDIVGPNYSYRIRQNATENNNGKYQGIMSTSFGAISKLQRSYSNNWRTLYMERGFSALQSVVDTFILHDAGALKFENEASITPARVDDHLKMYLQPFPTPAYQSDDFADFVGGMLGLFYALVFIWSVTRIVSSIVEEKELKIKMGMKQMGLSETALVASWWTTYALMFVVTCIIIAAMTSSNLYENSNGAIIFFFFFLFCLTVYSFSFLMSSIFDKARAGSTFSAIIFLVLFFLYYLVEGEGTDRGTKILASLSPTICLSLGVTSAAELESSGLGVNNDTISIVIKNWSIADSIGMFIFDIIVFFLLALYINQIKPGEFGVPKKWYFLCTPKFWCGSSRDRRAGVCSCCFATGEENANLPDNVEMATLGPDANEPFTLMENQTHPDRAIVQLRGLRKTFPSPANSEGFVAVKGLSLDMYKGQVFCLLGENGAGKSTAINMLTGLYPPSAGTATINGYDITTDTHAIYQQQGVCMQHDILYPYLSVMEHLNLYASIKGVPAAERETEINEMVEKIGLGTTGDNKMNAMAGTLSGGQMRKLSVGIALLNKPAVVYLDEPSSGMDVASQRHIWDLILSQKKDRVIVLTSHFMEEVETLGDNIGIMAGGRLICLGSQRYLKDQYGVGYTLTISKITTNQADRVDRAQLHPGTTTLSGSKIAKFMQDRYPFAQLTSDAGGEISFRMPFSASAGFPDMFDDLEARKQELALTTFGVAVTTMTEVFLKVVSSENREVQEAKAIAAEGGDVAAAHAHEEEAEHHVSTGVNEDDEWGSTEGTRIDNQWTLFKLHFTALFTKRFHNARRDRKQWMWSLLYPGIILLVSLLALTLAIPGGFPVRSMSPTIYEKPNDYPYADNTGDATIQDIYSYLAAANNGGVDGLGITPQQLDTSVFPASATGITPTQMNQYLFDSYFTRSIDNLRTGALAINAVSQFPPPATVTSDADVATIEAQIYFNTTAQEAMPVYMNLLHNMILRAGTGDNTATITTDVKPFDLTAKQVALTTASLAFSVAIAFCFVSATYAGFLVKERADKVKHLQVVSGVSPAAYWLSTYVWDIINFVFPFALLLILLVAFDTTALVGEGKVGPLILTTWLFALAAAPFVYCLSFLFESHVSAQNTTLLLNFLFSVVLLIVSVIMQIIESTRDINHSLRFIYRLFPAFCFGDAVAMMLLAESIYPGESIWSMDILGFDLLFLFIDLVIYTILLLLLEHWSSSNTMDWIRGGCGSSATVTPIEDHTDNDEEDDVRAERERIERGECDDTSIFSVVLKGLRKVYPSRMGAKPHVAVSNLFFSVKKGECIGFLGANGAGKSTTMKMLTGDVYPSDGSGTALLGGLDLLQEPYEVRRLLGYCPQFDALFPLMTGREHLYLFARIKCVPAEKLDGFVSYMIRKLGLVHLADKPAGTYSGGNKRKLSVGLSLIGNPSIVFLDEPSTGVDPQSRRFMWNLISSTMQHRSVILTTHSMEEAQALSDRITIITSGKLRALGTSQYLKSKYGAGWQCVARSQPGHQQDVINFFQKQFPGTVVIEAHTVNIKLRIPKEATTLANVFRVIEAGKQTSFIDSYSVSETDLEQIFINFVNADVVRNAESRGVHAHIPTGQDQPQE